MSARKAFTLIEVTLSIVIGIILIAGATLLYNQAKLGAGNTRAKAKVIALQGLIEEMAASNGGTYPTSGPAVYSLWMQRRPDDYAQSPWGGAVNAVGWGNGSFPGLIVSQPGVVTGGTWGPDGFAIPGCTSGGQPLLCGPGNLFYVTTSGAAGSFYDFSTGAQVAYKNYFTMAVDAAGNYGWFVQSGK